MEDFSISGVTTAVLNDEGTTQVRNDVLHKARGRSLYSLSSDIGSGSNQDCFFGASWISFVTSATVIESNDENWVTFTSWCWGGGADFAMLRTFSTLNVNKADKSCGENDDELGALLRLRTVLNVCQRRPGFVEFAACDRRNPLLVCSTRRCEVLSACIATIPSTYWRTWQSGDYANSISVWPSGPYRAYRARAALMGSLLFW